MLPSDLLSVALAILFPLVAEWAARRGWLPRWLSSIILCYGIGIAIANLRLWTIDKALLEGLAGGGMLVGLPLLLFSVRIRDLSRYGSTMLWSFLLCCIAGVACTAATAVLFRHSMTDGWRIAGMLTGLYTGGTPNVQAIGIALEAPPEYVVLIQAADVLLGGSYLIGLVSFLPALYGKFFAPTPAGRTEDEGPAGPRAPSWPQRGVQLVWSLGVVVVSLLVSRGLTGTWFAPTMLILMVTTLSILLTLTPAVRRMGDSYPLGEYFVLVFCVSLGLLADFRQLAAEGAELLLFSAVALGATTVLHLLFAKVTNIDRDTVILSSVAAFYGPVFVVQVAAALRNTRLLAAGVAVSLLGFGIGNYLGIGIAYALRWAVY